MRESNLISKSQINGVTFAISCTILLFAVFNLLLLLLFLDVEIHNQHIIYAIKLIFMIAFSLLALQIIELRRLISSFTKSIIVSMLLGSIISLLIPIS